MISPKGASTIASDKTRPALVLASESPRRKALLAQIGIVPDAVIAGHINETVKKGELPREHARRLAAEKARAVAENWTGGAALILAADTVVACGRRILPKAESDDQVRQCLALLSGRRHQVLTAIALIGGGGKLRQRIVMTRVGFVRLTTARIEAYVESREGLGKAGGYAIQGRAEAFVAALNGSYSNVVGLPLTETVGLLTGCGYPAL
ncbi:MAG TPA: nucleoside triphosphate pyrophosphatase [Rhizomicrobium sp.]